jgi:hypothetical protein
LVVTNTLKIMRGTMLLSATSNGVGVNVRLVGYGLSVSRYQGIYTYTFYTDSVLNVYSTLTCCLAVVFGGGFGSETRSRPFGPRSVLAMFAIVRLSWLLVVSSSSTLALLGFSFSTLLSSASGLRFDAGCVVAFSCSSFAAERRGVVPLGEVVVIAIGWVTKSSS